MRIEHDDLDPAAAGLREVVSGGAPDDARTHHCHGGRWANSTRHVGTTRGQVLFLYSLRLIARFRFSVAVTTALAFGD